MDEEIRRVVPGMNTGPSTSTAFIQTKLKAAGIRAPADYVEFMAEANGAEGSIGPEGYLVIWPIEAIEEMNRLYATTEFAPGLVLFGSDGGDTAYAFDQRHEGRIVQVPFIGMSLGEVQDLAARFHDFLALLADPATP